MYLPSPNSYGKSEAKRNHILPDGIWFRQVDEFNLVTITDKRILGF